MRILFVEPPITDYPNPTPNTGMNLGILSLVSYLRKQGIQADFRFISEQIELATSGKLSAFRNCLESWGPNIVCISALTAHFPRAIKLAREAKKIGATVILGNIYPSMNAEEILLNSDSVDLIVIGEGELTLSELLNHMAQGSDWRNTKGIAFKSSAKGIFSSRRSSLPDLTQLPLPAYDLLPLDDCRSLGLYFTIETARGCPFRCTFCTLAEYWRGYRMKCIEQVISELKMVQELGFHHTVFTDDTFTANRNRTISLCKAIIDEDLDLQIYVLTRIDLIDEELLDLMAAAGINEILFGVEHIDQQSLESMSKTPQPNQWADLVESKINSVASLNCTAHPVFMIGWPGDTPEKMEKMVDFAVRIGSSPYVEPFVAFATPHPGSQLWKQRDDLGLEVITSDLSKFIHLYPVAVPRSLGPEGIELMIESHNIIRSQTGMSSRNPCIELEFVLSYADLL
jgi:anaerobic magnesium-protoporphyrin IX monomethyl ester cyclase